MEQSFNIYNTNTIETDYNSSIAQLLNMLAEEAAYQKMRKIISDPNWGNAILNPSPRPNTESVDAYLLRVSNL